MLLLVLLVLPALLNAGPVDQRPSSQQRPPANIQRRHHNDHPYRSSTPIKRSYMSPQSQSYHTYESTRPNNAYMPTQTYSPSQYEQEASSLVSGLLVTRLAEDFARLAQHGLRSKETRIPVYVAITEEDEDGLPTKKSIPKLVHLLDASTQKNKEVGMFEEVMEAPSGGLYTPTSSSRQESSQVDSTGHSSSSVNTGYTTAHPTPTTKAPTSAAPSEQARTAAKAAEIDVMHKIESMLKQQQENLFKQHVENVIKDQLANLVKHQVSQVAREHLSSQGHRYNRPIYDDVSRQYLDHMTSGSSTSQRPRISVGEKPALGSPSVFLPTAQESSQDEEKLTQSMIEQIQKHLSDLNTQLNQTAAVPERPVVVAHEGAQEALEVKEAQRRLWVEEQLRRMSMEERLPVVVSGPGGRGDQGEDAGLHDLHASEQKHIMSELLHHLRRPRDIDQRMEGEEEEIEEDKSLLEGEDSVRIPMIFLPRKSASREDNVEETNYPSEGDHHHHSADLDQEEQE